MLLGTWLKAVYRVYKKKGNRFLECSSAFIIYSTEIILLQSERPEAGCSKAVWLKRLISLEYRNTLCIHWTTELKYFNLKRTLMHITTHLVFKTLKKFSRSQDKWKCDLNLTYLPFKLNSLRTTGPRLLAFECHLFCEVWRKIEQIRTKLPVEIAYIFTSEHYYGSGWEKKMPLIIYRSRETINVANKMHSFYYLS